MKYTLEVWDDSKCLDKSDGKKNNEDLDLIATYEFDTLEEGKKFARELITKDEEKGLDYSYFLIDEGEEVYDIWEG